MKKYENLPTSTLWRNWIPASMLTLCFLLFQGLQSQEPTSVTIAGNLQDELGCPGDWQPDCSSTYLFFEGEDGVWQAVFNIPAGNYEYKAAIDDSWDENYGANAQPNGSNIALSLAEPTDVKFYYDHETHWITDNVNSAIATVVGNFQPAFGCPQWNPGCLQSWLQDPDGDGIFTFTTDQIPAGFYEAKVAHNESWDENYGLDGIPDGPNIPFTVPYDGAFVEFIYDLSTHVLNIYPPFQPESVTIVGSLQDELGCPSDWMPDCSNTYLNLSPEDEIWRGTFDIPAGDYFYKAALNNSWNENYGANAMPGGSDIPLNLSDPTEVKFYYDHHSHWVTDNVNSVIAVAAGSFQSELGCGGDWQPWCLKSWLKDIDGDGIYTIYTNEIPPGDYEVKVAHDESWDENYGAGGVQNGPNIPFTVPYEGAWMLFSYDPGTHILTIEHQETPSGTIVIQKKVFGEPMPGIDFEFTTNHFLTIASPLAIAGDYPASSASFGPSLDLIGVSGELELVNDAVPPSTNGCEPLAGFTPGKIALVDRGDCYFVDKVQNAQDAGAIAVVIVNNVPGGTPIMCCPVPGLTIPTIMITQDDGEMIKATLESETVAATLRSESIGFFTLQDDEEITIENLPIGLYHFTELNPIDKGFRLAQIQITDPDAGSWEDVGLSTAMLDLDPGETIHCTFYNETCALYAIDPWEIFVNLPSGGVTTKTFMLDNYPDPAGQDLHYGIMSPFTDDFESYIAGEQLACQNPMQWTTWNNSPCSVRDPFISSAYAQSGSNSVMIKRNEFNQSVGLVKYLDVPVGVWEISFGIYIPSGKSGFFQSAVWADPGPIVAFTCEFDPGGNGNLTAGSPEPVAFGFEHDAWQKVKIIADMESDLGEFWFNGEMVHSWTWTDGVGTGAPLHLGFMNFFSQENDELYFDDFMFRNYPNCSFISKVFPTAGIVPDGSNQEIAITADASELMMGDYMCHLWINGNSCYGPQMIPIHLLVGDDIEPPVINLTDASIIWPPNHKYESFSLQDMVISVTDNFDGMIPIDQVSIDWARSDEPDDAPGNGDGKTKHDIVIGDDCKWVKLRKERQGGGNGRVYTVHLSVADAAGNVGTAEYQVKVPYDDNWIAIDDGPDHTVYCGIGMESIMQVGNVSDNVFGLVTYPNPFSGATTIEFTLEETGPVTLEVYNALGENMGTLFNGKAEAGINHSIEFNGLNLPEGIYYCKLQTANGETALSKMILIR